MKDYITNFDLEAAFKALDDIDIPVVDGVIANKAPLTEIFNPKTKLEHLVEDYYNINDSEELDSAKADLEADIAAAKLARIEKIVDLDAKSPDELQPSYVGKYIIQCPQCMTLFYKDKEDVVESEDDPEVVNVNEVCQHCGNESGYTLVGKVGEADPEEESPAEEPKQDDSEELPEVSDEDIDLDIDETADSEEDLDIDFELEDDEAEQTEESLEIAVSTEQLNESLTEDAFEEVSEAEFEKLIQSPEFKKPISDNEVQGILDELEENANKPLVEHNADFDGFNSSYYTNDADYMSVAECLIDSTMHSGKFLYASWVKDAPTVKQIDKYTYRVTHHKGGASVTVKFTIADEDAMLLDFTVDGKQFITNYSDKAQDFILAELDKAYVKSFDVSVEEACLKKKICDDVKLTEGVFDKVVDKLNSNKAKRELKKREDKADFILKSALKDYDNIKIDDKGEIVTSDSNRKFKAFVVFCFKETYSNGKLITTAPSFNNKDLTLGREPVEAKNYKAADNFAKGWSSKQGNGPAYIFVAEDKNDNAAAFLCQYFKGKLVDDQLEKYFELVKKDADSSKLMNAGLRGADKDKGKSDTKQKTKEPSAEKDSDDSAT